MPNGYFKKNSDGTIDVVATEVEATTVTAATIAASDSLAAKRYYINTPVEYTADGAIDLTTSMAILKAGSASTQMTLADGTEGQLMIIVCSDASNTCDVDANFGGAIVTATFTAAGDSISLASDGTEWFVVGNNGATLS